MNKLLVSAIALIVLSGGFAQAALVTSEDVVVLNTFLPGFCDCVSYTHDMTNPSSGPAFDPLTDVVTSASLLICFRDDETVEFWWSPETVMVFEDGNLVATRIIPDDLGEIPDFGIDWENFSVNLSFIQDDGKLDVELCALLPDFLVDSSKLTIEFDQGRNGTPEEGPSVPEPATLTLLGLGTLIAAAASRRKKRI